MDLPKLNPLKNNERKTLDQQFNDVYTHLGKIVKKIAEQIDIDIVEEAGGEFLTVTAAP